MTLAAVTRAARARLASELRYKQAVEAAAELRRADGHKEYTLAEIGDAAGVSRQAVSQLLRRSRSH